MVNRSDYLSWKQEPDHREKSCPGVLVSSHRKKVAAVSRSQEIARVTSRHPSQSAIVDSVKEGTSYVHCPTSNFQKAVSNFAPETSGDIARLFDADRKETKKPCKSGVDTLVLDWYVDLLDPPEAYLEHLDYFREHDREGGFTDYPAGGSIEGFYFYKHKGEEDTWVAVPEVKCDPYNPCAKFKSIRSSASRTYSQLENLKGCENIVFLDLTFPKEISELLLTPDRFKVIEKARSCVDRFIELLKENLASHINEHKSSGEQRAIPSEASLGYQYNPHLWKTSDPTSPHLHMHLDLLWAFFEGEELHALKFHEKGKPLSKDFVKALWRSAVSEIFDYDYGDRDPSVYLAWAPLSWGSKVLHRLKYRRRKPITDLAEYYLDHEFNPDHFDYDFNEFLLDYTNRSYSGGFWCFLVRLLKGASSVSANVKICPICGEKVAEKVYVPLGEAAFDRVVVLTRSGEAYSVKPPPGGDLNI